MRPVPACLLLALLMPSPAVAQTPAPPRLSLDAALAQALAHNRTLADAALDIEMAKDEVATARSKRRPSFSVNTLVGALLTPIEFTFPAGSFGTYPTVGPIPDRDSVIKSEGKVVTWITATMSQPLTQLFKTGLAVDASKLQHEMQGERLRAMRLDVVTSVKSIYFQLLQVTSALDATEANLLVYRELDRMLGDRVAQKTALRVEQLDVQVTLAQEELARTTRRHTRDSLQERLNQLLGRDVRERFTVEPMVAGPPPALDLALVQGQALERRPDVRQARLAVKQAELDHRITRAERIPDLNATLSYLSPYNADPLPTTIASVGLQLQWEPFDWGRGARKSAGKARRVEQARHQVREAEDRAVLEINAAMRRIEEAHAGLRVAHAAQEAAREQVRVRTNQFKAQAALLADVLQAQASAASADDRYQQTLLELWDARARLDQALGEDGTR